MAGVSEPQPRLRVKAIVPSRRRAGFAFTREAVELLREDLGGSDLDEVAGLERLLAIAEDPLLDCVFIDEDGGEHRLDADKLAEIRQVADRKAALAASPASPDVATIAEQLLGTDTAEFQPASGATGEAGGDASPPVDPEATSGEANASATPANSPGTEPSSAEGSGQSRQAADEPATDQATGTDEGNQPEETPVPPVAEAENVPSAAPAAGKPARKVKHTEATPEKA